MKIEKNAIKVSKLVDQYVNSDEEGVRGYSGKLDIRPRYQREFIYKPKQQELVIESILEGCPLNTMYWAVRDDGTFEIIDGQQRTISICEFIENNYSVTNLFTNNRPKSFSRLSDTVQKRILDYSLDIYLCYGTSEEKLRWFEKINVVGEKLKEQELLNAVYVSEWLLDAKRYFSKSNCSAWNIGKNYMSGTPIRQDYLHTVLKWITKGNIKEYMLNRMNQKDQSAEELWKYFNNIIDWIKATFPKTRPKLMQGIDWGYLYETYHKEYRNARDLEKRISELLKSDILKNAKGIYRFVLSGDKRDLSFRNFTNKEKWAKFEEQKGICVICEEKFVFDDMEGDHVIAWSEGGDTLMNNLQMLCKNCNRRKSNK